MSKLLTVFVVAFCVCVGGCSTSRKLPDGRMLPKDGFPPSSGASSGIPLRFDGWYCIDYDGDGGKNYYRFWPDGQMFASATYYGNERFNDFGHGGLGYYYPIGGGRFKIALWGAVGGNSASYWYLHAFVEEDGQRVVRITSGDERERVGPRAVFEFVPVKGPRLPADW